MQVNIMVTIEEYKGTKEYVGKHRIRAWTIGLLVHYNFNKEHLLCSYVPRQG